MKLHADLPDAAPPDPSDGSVRLPRDDAGRLYGIEREAATARRSPGWMVRVRRRGRIVARLFKDGVHGSSEAALAQALAYRDAVVAAVPPMTNREQAVRLRRNNTSGVSGVTRKDLADGPTWHVALTTNAGSQRMSFSVAQHGEERARALALAQRQAWLEALPPAFLVADAQAAAITYDRFAHTLDRPVDIHPNEAMTVEEMTARLAAIDAHFDSLRPKRLRVRVKQYYEARISVAVSDAGWPARRHLIQVTTRKRPVAVLVDEIVATIGEVATELYDEGTAAWFMKTHVMAHLAPECFQPRTGFMLCVAVPVAVTQ